MEQLIIVKVGGGVVEDEVQLASLLKDFSSIVGKKILVHGGGRLATKIAADLGLESQLIEGRRVTDEAMLKVATMVYGGWINKKIVSQLQSFDVNAIGLSGADMNLMRSVKRPVDPIDYGFVGDVKDVSTDMFHLLLQNGLVPVLAPLTHDKEGQLLNTNADTIAAETAKAMSSMYNVMLIYCFEKKGVLLDEHDEESVIPDLDRALFDRYREEGIIQGGMIPKLENAFDAIGRGVKRVIVTNAGMLLKGGGTTIC